METTVGFRVQGVRHERKQSLGFGLKVLIGAPGP